MAKLGRARRELLQRVVSVMLCVAMIIEGVPPTAVAYALDETFGDASSTVVIGASDTDEGGGVSGDTGIDVVPSSDAVDSESTLAVEPEPEPEHVRFVFETGVGKGDEHQVTGSMPDYDFVMDGEVHALPENGFVRDGFEFLGWSTTLDGKDIKDDPETEADESFKALLLMDGIEMIDLGYDELVEDTETDSDGNVVVTGTHVVPHNLEYAKRSDTITLYAQWQEIVSDVVEETQVEQDVAEIETAPKDTSTDSGEDAAAIDVVPSVKDTVDDAQTADGNTDKTDNVDKDDAGADDKANAESVGKDVSGAPKAVEDADKNVISEPVDKVAPKKGESEGESELSASVTVADDGLTGVVVTGDSDDANEIANAIAVAPKMSRSKSLSMAKRMAGALRMPVPAEDEDVPRQKDGSFIENISVSWVTEDTVDNGDESLLYVKPTGDIPFSVRAVVDYALSGEHDYEAGDVIITVPAKVFYNRDGADAQTWVYPYPEEPSTNADFMWSRVGDTIVFTNTHRLQAATKGFIEFDMSRLVPHKLVDMATTDPFWARIEVSTHLGNVIGLSSDEIRAQVDTEEKVTSAYKYNNYSPYIVDVSEVPESARVAGESNYVIVPWTMYGYVEGNTEFTLSLEDHKTDEYRGKIMYPDVADSYGENLFSGYTAGNVDGTQGTKLGTKVVRVAYPLSQFEPDVTYTFKNQVTYTLTEADPAVGDDPRLVTTQVAPASCNWSWHLPKFKDPEGHFMVQKYGNDGDKGRNPYYSHYVYNRSRAYYDCSIWNSTNGYFGTYPSALNELRDGRPVELFYTLDSTGYLLPWTLDGDPRVSENYGKREVTMVTTDTDDTADKDAWFENLGLELGRDYKYKYVEFPQAPCIYEALAVNLDADGNFVAITAGDGTVDYARDYVAEHIPDIALDVKVGGSWRRVAVASWKTGSLAITPVGGILVDGIRVVLPEGTEQVRTSVTTNIAGIEYHVRPVIELFPSDEVSGVVEALFENDSAPHGEVYNTTYMNAYDDTGARIVDIHKNMYDELGGYSTDIAVLPTKNFRQVKVDVDRREVRVHYGVSVDERSFIPDKTLWEDAVADGYLVPDTSGVFYDLLPLGMSPVVSSVKLRSGDSVRDAYTVEDWRGTGRTMLIVEADLTPVPEEYDDDGRLRIHDELTLDFNATYPFESVVDYGFDTHNVVAYESLVREPLGTISGKGAEADDPTSRNNVATSQAFKTADEVLAMTGLDDDREGERFVYAGVDGTIDMPSAARTSLSKDIQVNNDGRWSQGTYEDKRTVYEGGTYSYRLRMMSDARTKSRDLVMYDSLENFYAAQGNDEVDIDAPRWRGELVAVDTLQLRLMGCDPVVYYSTVDQLQLADESDPNRANDTNTNLDDASIWVKVADYDGDLSDVHAVAIDCRKRTNGTAFVLEPLESATAIIRMHAPHGEPAREYIAEDAHAYNNIYLKCTSIDADSGIANGRNFVRHDYTKVGLEEFEISATKVWDDDDDRDGVRPDEVTFQLVANGSEVVQTATASGPDWSATFRNMPYTDGNGRTIRYSVKEVVPAGYASSVLHDGYAFELTNRHVPETVRLTGSKTWVGGEEAIPESVTVRLLADGEIVATKVVRPDGDGAWSYDFGEKPKYRDHGTEIVYTVDETKVPAAWVPSYAAGTLDIENAYHPYGDLVIAKQAFGETEGHTGNRFDIRVSFTDAEGEMLSDEYAYETSDGRSGNIMSGGTIALADDETATIHELPEGARYTVDESVPAGYTMSGENLSGTIVANKDNDVSVDNTYSAKGFVNLGAKKELSGRALRRYQFRFELSGEDGELLRTTSNKADGTAIFGALNYTQADVGEHVYTIRETVTDRAGYTYDERVYTARVSVSDNGNGTLSTSVRYEDAEGEDVEIPLFENSYHAEGSITLRAWKKLEGRALTAGEFSFELLDENGERVGNVVTNEATGEIAFDEMTFDQDDAGKTFRFVAHEIAGDDATVSYSAEAYSYTVAVVDNGDGTLSFAQDTSSASVGEPRPLRWDEASEEQRSNLIWYDSNSDKIDIYCSGDKMVGINRETGRPPHTEYTSEANDVAASVLSLAYGIPITRSDILSSYDNQWRGPVRYFSSGNVVDRLWDPLSITFPRIITLAESIGSDSAAQICKIRFFSTETMSDQHIPYLRAFGTETIDVNIEDEVDVTPVFTNTLKPGSLRIEKHVANVDDAHAADQFRFKVKLTGDDVADLEGLDYTHEQIAVPTGAIMPNGVFGGLGAVWDMVAQLFSVRSAYAAEDDIASGKIGTGPTGGIDWRVTASGELIIGDGTQNQMFYPNNPGNLPWYSVREQITSARVSGEVKVFYDAATSLFSNLPNVMTIDVTGLDTSEATNISNMFGVDSSLTEIIGLDTLDTSHVAVFSSMFTGCSSLLSLDLHTFDMSSAQDISNMFYDMDSCKSLNVSGWASESLTFSRSFSENFFDSLISCREIDMSGWNFPNLTSMHEMFYGMPNLEFVDVTDVYTSHVSDFSDLFYYSKKLKEIRGLETWDTSLGVRFGYMFDQCYALGSLDLSAFDVSNGRYFSCMLRGLKSCKNINLSGWKFRSVPANGTINLCGSSMAYWEHIDASDWWVPSASSAMLYTCFGTNDDASYNGYTIDVSGWEFGDSGDFTTLFYDSYAKSIIGLDTWDTSQTRVMSRMFEHMPKLTYLDLSGFDTSNVVNMGSMCSDMPKLEAIDLTGFETQNVRNFSYMFANDLSLRELNVSSFDVSSGTTFTGMFSGMPQLERIYSAPDADWSRQATSFSDSPVGPFSSESSMLSGGEGTTVEDVGTSTYFARVDGLEDSDGNERRGLFTAGVYSITFDANGGSGYMPITYRFAGSDASIPRSSLRRFGYVQSGWEDQDGNVYELDGTIPAGTFSEGDRAVLKAVWEEEETRVDLEDGEFYVTLGANEAATFDGLPAGAAYSVFEETSEGWVLVLQSNTSGNIAPVETSVAEFTNRYDEASTSISLGGTKMLDGRGAAEGAFTFELREDGQLIESVTNAAGGGISFSPIVYGEGDVGTHVYTIEEVSGNDSTVIYDTHTETVVVEVSMNGRNLSAVPTYDGDGAVFANETLPGSIEISKETVGGGDPDQEFEFEVELKGVLGAVGTSGESVDVLGWFVDGLRQLFAPRKAYAATTWSQWTQYGSSVEWRIDESGMLCIQPIEGNRGVLKWSESKDSPPWHDYFEQIRGLSIPEGKTIECQGSLYQMFYYCANIVTLDTRGLDTSKVTSMERMFTGCSSLREVPDLDYSNVRSTHLMFERCSALSDIDLSGVEFPELVDAEYMFRDCTAVQSIDISGMSAPKLENANSMFGNAYNCISFNATGVYLPSVNNCANMLQGLGNNRTGSDVYVNLRGITWGPTMAFLLYNNGFAKYHVDLTGADLSRVVDAMAAFCYLGNGVELKMPEVVFSSLESADNMLMRFGGYAVGHDIDIDIHGCDFGQANVRSLLSYAGVAGNGGILNAAGIDLSDCSDSSSLVSGVQFSKIDLSNVDLTGFGSREFDVRTKFLDVHGCKLPESCYEFFRGYDITEIDMHDADTSAVTNMSYMFNRQSALQLIDLSGIDTSHVTDMSHMFDDCSDLGELDLSGFDTSHVTDMSYMFEDCGELYELNLSGFDTSRVTDMSHMFEKCYSLYELDLSGFDVSSLTEMSDMFKNCSSLETIYTKADADWPIDATIDSDYVFSGCTSLVGGDGTMFDSSVVGAEMARVDGLDGEPGYFTNGTGDTVVSFGANGGSIVVGESHVMMRNRVMDVSVPKVMRDGYVLVGWNTKADGTGVDYGTPNKVTPAQGRSLSLYAQWVPEGEAYTYRVVHRLEKADELGSFEVTGRETRHAGSLDDVMVTPNSYYGFVKPVARTVDIAEDGSTEVTFDYTRARVTVTYVFSDGSTRTQIMLGGVRTALEAAPAIEGKRFVGWLDGAHGENGFYADGQAVSLGADTTLYAHYVDEGAEDDYEGTSRVIHVRVKAGETVTIPNVPAGAVYEVREVNVPSGWKQVSIKNATGVVGANDVVSVRAKNAYSASGKFDIVAHKSLIGGELVDGAFSFELLDAGGRVVARSVNGGIDTAETIVDALSGNAIANPYRGTGAVNFRDLSVTEPGTYTYTIREVAGRDSNVVYDGHAETVTVVATDRGDGTLACDVHYDADGAVFMNRVKPPEERTYEGDSGNLSVTKTIVQGPADKTFGFDVEARDADGNPLNATFETRVYTGGTATYTHEDVWHTSNIADSGAKLGEVASSTWEYGTVSVPGAESIHLEFDYTNVRGEFYIWAGDHTAQVAEPNYDSSFSPSTADVNIGYADTSNDNILLHGSADIDGDIATIAYRCYAYSQDSCPPDNGGYNEWTNYGCFVRATGEIESDAYDQGSVTFTDGHAMLDVAGGQTKHIVGLPAGATYRIVEQDTDGWQQVSAAGNEGTIPKDGTAEASFSNVYLPEGSFDIRGKKVGVGLDVVEGAYTFELYDKNGFVARATNDADGNIVFADLPIDVEWVGTTRTYTVSEIPGDDDAVLWDTHADEVKVTFADDGEGHLSAEVAYDADDCVFTNERVISIPMPGTGMGGIPFSGVAYGMAAVVVALSVLAVRRRRKECA